MSEDKLYDQSEVKSAVELTPSQLNALGFGSLHTVLTPELLERMSIVQNMSDGD